jgi:anti-sigma regulatory factor (Ser/Thr protein kinase)
MNSRLELRVPPDPRYAKTVREAMAGFGCLNGVGEDDIEALLAAVGEALANAIEHARASRDIEVIVEIDDARFIATVTDHGRGCSRIPRGTAPLPEVLAERGRGIPIMQRCTHLFEVRSTPGRGTTVVLGRYLRVRQETSAIA